MTNPHGPLAGEENSIEEGNPFRFVSVDNPSATRDPKSSRLVRSHAVKQGLKAKRKFQEESNGNFRVGFPTRDIKTSPSIDSASLYSSASTHDPFDMLVVDSWRLKSLLGYSSQNAGPIARVQDDVVLKAFQSVFRTDVDDPALSNAVMLTYSFEVTGGSINQECLGYLNKATKSISERMSSSTTAASVTVIGAILLLAGIEARLGMRAQVQLHIGAIRHLLGVCAKEQVYLNDGIKRAIFWQDLNCSIMTGSSPIFDHTTFAELQWRRDSFLTHIYVLSPGFKRLLDMLNEEFVEVLEDLLGLQSIRDCPNFDCYDATDMIRVDNHQASIQSRLAGLSATKVPLLSECCHLAAYIFACQLCCKVWRASSIPVVSCITATAWQTATGGRRWRVGRTSRPVTLAGIYGRGF
ncbi:hypothetical protein V490_01321 [Pseudogymnoascus sp. VKM F-3557]|nr:hypothetical protein V490_01321 [Pseudogymnoascus sp. VKM F-3557]